MKNYFFLFFIPLLFAFTCDGDPLIEENNDLLGQWKLIEKFFSPGGGVINQPVDSDMTLVFLPNGVLRIRNGSLCSSAVNPLAMDRYSIQDSTILLSCPKTDPVRFELKEGFLFIYYLQCIEPCGLKFQRQQEL